MKLSLFGRFAMALFASFVLGLGMTACGGGTIAYIWVLGQQSGSTPGNQIAGFKVDDYTGNLTEMPHSPFAANGSNPVSIVVKPGGRFVFVLNQGTGASSSSAGNSAGVSVFLVGGEGTLVYQATYASQGYDPQWLALDTTGNYLYELDKYAPTYDTLTGKYDIPNANNGAITAFAIDQSTGRLTLVQNSQILNGGLNTPYFTVGQNPFMMAKVGSCLLTVNSADNSISPYSFGGGGQLSFSGSTGRYQIPNASHISSINGAGNYVYLTDSGNNTILPFTLSSGCVLTPVTGGTTVNQAGTSNPVYSLADGSSKYLYVLNNQITNCTGTSQSCGSISAFSINQTNGQLTANIPGSPYTVGSGPVCMVEDSSNQYMYISNHNDGTITGKHFDPTTGILSQLSRGSTFNAVTQATCLAISGSVD